MKMGIIGSGAIGRVIATKAIQAGHDVILSNSRGPESLAELTAELGDRATAGTVLEAAQQEIVLLAVPWIKIAETVDNLPNWENRIVIDATNQFLSLSPEIKIADLEPLTSSEVVAKSLPGARVIKAFNSMYARFIDGEVDGGRRVLFYAGDNSEAKKIAAELFTEMGFYPHDLGSLAAGGRMMQLGGPLSAAHFIHREDE